MDVTTIVNNGGARNGRQRTLLRSFDGMSMRLNARASWYMYTSEIFDTQHGHNIELKIDALRNNETARYHDYTLLPLRDIPQELLSNDSYSLQGVTLLGLATYFGFPVPLNAYPRALSSLLLPTAADPPIYTNLGVFLRNAHDSMYRALNDVRAAPFVACRLLQHPKQRHRQINTSILHDVTVATRNIEKLLRSHS